jgi:phage gp45-like
MKSMLAGMLGNIRNAIGFGIVASVDDTGQAQTANVKTADGAGRADVEVVEPFGFSSVPPPDGIIATVIEIGGDPGNLVLLPLGNAWARFGAKSAGETVVYGADGSRVHIRVGGIVDIWGGAQVNIHSKNVTINAPLGCAVIGNVEITGDLTVSGNVSDAHGSLDRLRGHYNAHGHPPSSTPPTPLDSE